jgi:hypothetical protein
VFSTVSGLGFETSTILNPFISQPTAQPCDRFWRQPPTFWAKNIFTRFCANRQLLPVALSIFGLPFYANAFWFSILELI